MAYRDHSTLVHTWINQWNDDGKWTRRGAVFSLLEKYPSKKYTSGFYSSGTVRGGIQGCQYKSYNTTVGNIAWSPKLEQHVVLMEDPQGTGYSRTTNKTLSLLYHAIPSNYHVCFIASDETYLLDAYSSVDTSNPMSLDAVYCMAKVMKEELELEHWVGEARLTLAANRKKYIRRAANLLRLHEAFDFPEIITGKNDATEEEVASAVDSIRATIAGLREYSKNTAKELTEKQKQRQLQLAKVRFSKYIEQSDKTLQEIYKFFSDIKDLNIKFTNCNTQTNAEKAFRQAETFMRALLYLGINSDTFFTIDKSEEKVKVVDDGVLLALYASMLKKCSDMIYYLAEKLTPVNKDETNFVQPSLNVCKAINAYTQYSQLNCEPVGMHVNDVLYFWKDTCYTERYCTAPKKEVNVLLKLRAHNKAIVGKRVGNYTILENNETHIKVGCHKFKAEHINMLTELTNDYVPNAREQKYIDAIVNYIKSIINASGPEYV